MRSTPPYPAPEKRFREKKSRSLKKKEIIALMVPETELKLMRTENLIRDLQEQIKNNTDLMSLTFVTSPAEIENFIKKYKQKYGENMKTPERLFLQALLEKRQLQNRETSEDESRIRLQGKEAEEFQHFKQDKELEKLSEAARNDPLFAEIIKLKSRATTEELKLFLIKKNSELGEDAKSYLRKLIKYRKNP